MKENLSDYTAKIYLANESELDTYLVQLKEWYGGDVPLEEATKFSFKFGYIDSPSDA